MNALTETEITQLIEAESIIDTLVDGIIQKAVINNDDSTWGQFRTALESLQTEMTKAGIVGKWAKNLVPCDCGSSRAFWHGERHGFRYYACQQCADTIKANHDSLVHGATFLTRGLVPPRTQLREYFDELAEIVSQNPS